MRRVLGLLVLMGAAYAIKWLLDAGVQRRRVTEAGERLITWEGEGGAVPVESNRTAALTEAEAHEPPR